MDEKTLQKNLANIDRELVNLQTAHEIGLGLVKYYEYSGSSQEAVTFYGLSLTVASGERAWPFINVLMRKRNGTIVETTMVWTNGDSGMNFEAYSYGIGTAICDWKITSTSKLVITEAE